MSDDISLKFVMDGGGAVNEVDKISQAEQRLADSTKKAEKSLQDQTAVIERASKEQLSQLEKSFQRRLAAAEKTGESTVNIEQKFELQKLAIFDKEEKRKLALVEKYEKEKVRAIERANDDAARSLDEGAKASDGFSMSLGQIARSAAGIFGVSLSVSAVVDALKDYDERLDNISGKQDDMMQSAVALASLQAPGGVTAALKQAAVTGAAYGFKPAESFATFQRAQSVFPNAPKDAAVATMEMAQLTFDIETARENLRIAKRLGVSPADFNAMIVGAASTSAMGELEFGQAAPSVPLYQFGGEYETDFAFAVMNALSGGVRTARELPTAMRSAAVALTKENALTKKIKGFKNMGPLERLQAIGLYAQEKVGDTSFESLQEAGITELEQSTALDILLSETGYKALTDTLAAAPSFTKTFSPAARVQQIKSEDELHRKMYANRRFEAQIDVERLYGKESGLAASRDVELQTLGAEMGFGYGTDVETGKPRWAARMKSAVSPFLSIMGAVGSPGQIPNTAARTEAQSAAGEISQRATESAQPLADKLERLESALDRHLEGLRELSQSTDNLRDATTGTDTTPTPSPSPRNRNNE